MRARIPLSVVLAWSMANVLCTQLLAAPVFYALAESAGTTSLLEVDPDDPASTTQIGPTGVEGLFWMEYDPRNEWLLAAQSIEQKIYRLDPLTGSAIPFPGSTSSYRLQGMAYVPPLGEVLIAYSTGSGGDKRIGVVNTDGTITQLYDLGPAGVDDLDEIVWDRTRQQLYGFNSQQQTHYTIDIWDGSVSSFSFDEGYPCFGSISYENGLMYEVPRSVDPQGGTPDVWTRDPESADLLEYMGSIPGVDVVRGLAFVPEPSAIALMLVGSWLMSVRRRGI